MIHTERALDSQLRGVALGERGWGKAGLGRGKRVREGKGDALCGGAFLRPRIGESAPLVVLRGGPFPVVQNLIKLILGEALEAGHLAVGPGEAQRVRESDSGRLRG